jgi:hypothetical protein
MLKLRLDKACHLLVLVLKLLVLVLKLLVLVLKLLVLVLKLSVLVLKLWLGKSLRSAATHTYDLHYL